MKERLDYIDITKAFAIILVICGHINYPNVSPVIKQYLYAFHMPMFFVCTGLTFNTKKIYSKKIFVNIFLKKFKRLIVPYFIWALIYGQLSLQCLSKIIYGSHITLKESSNSSLWFLPALFLGFLIVEFFFFAVRKLYQKKQLFFSLITCIFCFFVAIFLPKIKNGYPFVLNPKSWTF